MGIRCRSEVRCTENNIFVLISAHARACVCVCVCVLSKIYWFAVSRTDIVCDEENLRIEFGRACFVRAFICA